MKFLKILRNFFNSGNTGFETASVAVLGKKDQAGRFSKRGDTKCTVQLGLEYSMK